MIREVVTMKEDASIEEACKNLYEKHVGSIIITDKKGQCIGIFTERDAIRVVARAIPLNSTLQEVMTTNVISIWEEASFAEAKQLFKNFGIRHLPVVDEHKHVVGILSIRSILDELLEL